MFSHISAGEKRWFFYGKKIETVNRYKYSNSPNTNTTYKNRTWADSIKDSLELCGFHDIWTDGRVENEKAFLSAFKQRMIKRFKQEWFTKISENDRFSTYFSFKTVHQ